MIPSLIGTKVSTPYGVGELRNFTHTQAWVLIGDRVVFMSASDVQIFEETLCSLLARRTFEGDADDY